MEAKILLCTTYIVFQMADGRHQDGTESGSAFFITYSASQFFSFTEMNFCMAVIKGSLHFVHITPHLVIMTFLFAFLLPYPSIDCHKYRKRLHILSCVSGLALNKVHS